MRDVSLQPIATSAVPQAVVKAAPRNREFSAYLRFGRQQSLCADTKSDDKKIWSDADAAEGHHGLVGIREKRQRLAEVQLDLGRVVRRVADRQILTEPQLEVPAACGEKKGPFERGRQIGSPSSMRLRCAAMG